MMWLPRSLFFESQYETIPMTMTAEIQIRALVARKKGEPPNLRAAAIVSVVGVVLQFAWERSAAEYRVDWLVDQRSGYGQSFCRQDGWGEELRHSMQGQPVYLYAKTSEQLPCERSRDKQDDHRTRTEVPWTWETTLAMKDMATSYGGTVQTYIAPGYRGTVHTWLPATEVKYMDTWLWTTEARYVCTGPQATEVQYRHTWPQGYRGTVHTWMATG